MIYEVIQDDFRTRRRLQTSVEVAVEVSDEQRRQRRDKMRREIAAGELKNRRWQSVLESINEVEMHKEAIAAEHVAKCAPWQAEFREIERANRCNFGTPSSG